ncbi:MAG: glycosyltransferase [Betaproteobacteria bacterium]
MRILQVVPTYFPATRYGGPIVAVHGLCSALAARGHDVQVLTTNVDGKGESGVPLGVPVLRDGVSVRYFPVPFARRTYWSPGMAAAARAMIGQTDIVHLHSIFLWPTWMAARTARHAGVPYVCSPRGMLEKSLIRRKSRWAKALWIALVERRNLESAAAVHATSEREAAELVRFGFDLPRIAVIPNGVDLRVPESSGSAAPDWLACIPPGAPLVTFLGRINWKKGLDRLVPAMAALPSAYLVVAGPDDEGERKALEALAARIGVRSRVIFPGPVHGWDKQALLRRSVALVLPSLSENFGNVVLEAMAASIPVVIAPQVGLAKLVRDAGAGIVVDGSVDSIAAALQSILGSPSLGTQMGARGRAAAESAFDWGTVAAAIERLYETILPRDHASSG